MQISRSLLLQRLRHALQWVIPVAVAADQVRSLLVTYQLAQQRFKEWEDEDNEEIQHQVRDVLSKVVSRCAAKDHQFWPKGLAVAAPTNDSSSDSSTGAAPPTSGRHAGNSGGTHDADDLWQLLGLSGGVAGAGHAVDERKLTPALHAQPAASALPQQPAPHPMAAAEYDQHPQSEQQTGEAPTIFQQAGQTAQRVQHKIVVVTFQEAFSQVVSRVAALQLPCGTLMAPPSPGVVRVTLRDVTSILGSTSAVRAASGTAEKLGRRVLVAADAARERLRASLPWPQVQLTRKSALRYGMDWRGVHWPVQPREPLERQLDII